MRGRTEKSRELMAEMLLAGVTVPQMAEALDVSYPHLCAVIYGRYESERVFQMAQDYVRRVRDGQEGAGGSPAEDAGDKS